MSSWYFPSVSGVKNLLAVQQIRVWSPGGMAAHPSIIAWEIPLTEELGGLWSVRLQKSWVWLNNSNRCELSHPMHFLQLSHLIYSDFISASHIQTYITFMMDLIYSHSQSLSFQWSITWYMFILEHMKITD